MVLLSSREMKQQAIRLVKQKQHSGKKTGKLINPSASAQTYKGPIQDRVDSSGQDLHVLTKGFTVTCQSSAGGVVNDVIAADATLINDWSALAAVYGEYRILGMKVTFMPDNRYSKVTTTVIPGISVVDRSGAGALTSYGIAMNHASAHLFSLEDPETREVKMENAEESQFINISAPVVKQWVKFYASGESITTLYGLYFVWLKIQFRGVE